MVQGEGHYQTFKWYYISLRNTPYADAEASGVSKGRGRGQVRPTRCTIRKARQAFIGLFTKPYVLVPAIERTGVEQRDRERVASYTSRMICR